MSEKSKFGGGLWDGRWKFGPVRFLATFLLQPCRCYIARCKTRTIDFKRKIFGARILHIINCPTPNWFGIGNQGNEFGDFRVLLRNQEVSVCVVVVVHNGTSPNNDYYTACSLANFSFSFRFTLRFGIESWQGLLVKLRCCPLPAKYGGMNNLPIFTGNSERFA